MNKSVDGSRAIQVVQLDKYFLYLPIYFARHKHWFGYLPRSVDVRFVNALSSTDERVYEELMDGSSDNSQKLFAIIDPIQAIKQPRFYNKDVAIIGALVTNAAFWAVDRKSPVISRLGDLGQFKKIIALQEGTTSYAIASHACRAAGRDIEAEKPIITVGQRGQELQRLQKSNPGTIALSPNLDDIDALLFNHDEFNIHLALGNLPEYSNVLVTALATTRQTVEQERDLVLGLLSAIQRAMMFVRSKHPDVVKYASEYFNETEEPKRSAQERILSALDRANEAHVFPASIEVTEPQWINAAKATFPEMPEEDAEKCGYDTFDKSVRYYSHLAHQASTDALFPPERGMHAGMAVAALAGAAVCGTIAAVLLGWFAVICGLCLLFGGLLQWAAKLKTRSFLSVVHWGIIAAFLVITACGKSGWFDGIGDWGKPLLISMLAGLPILDLSVMISIAVKARHGGGDA